jgi:cytochrome c biogenesis protein CcdA
MPAWPQFALGFAIAVLMVHLGFILWVIFGAVFTRSRKWLAWAHGICVVYGLVIELAPWPCPLTLAENWFEIRAGRTPYRGPFLLHYLDAIVYPAVPPQILIWGAAIVLIANAIVYWRRIRPAGRPATG